jgi:energy-coupling factor transport system permease protein
MDPRTRLLLLVALGLLSILLDRPSSLLGLAVGAALPLLALPIGWVWRWRALGMAAAVVWATVLSQGLFYGDVPREPLVGLGPIVLYKEGVLHGLAQSLRLVAMTFAGLAVALSTSPDRLFAGLVSLRCPYAVAFLAVTALRFVPVVGREIWLVRRARSRRGRALAARTPWRWGHQELLLLRPVIARSLRRARALAEALDTRGFDPNVPRRLRVPLRMRTWEKVLLVAVGGLITSIATLELLYGMYLAELYYNPALRPLLGWVRDWL